MGLELAAQTGLRLPKRDFYPTGGGTGLIGMWESVRRIGGARLDRARAAQDVRRPGKRLRADRQGVGRRREHAERWEDAHTVRGHPRSQGGRRFLILRAVRESGGRGIAVDDADILAARPTTARGGTGC